MKKISCLFLALILLAFTGKNIESRKIYADNSASSIVYFMSHPMHDWDASAKTFKTVITYDDATKQINSVASVAKVQSFDSGNSNRDSHAIEVLDALRNPNITFVSNDIKEDGENLKIDGKLTFHGVTKPVTLNAIRKDAKSIMTITGKMEINMTDFGVEPPGLMGISAKETIRIDYTMTFRM
ncbi:MAG: YceI family protein [Spirosomaceae bacterium]|nr:YceI family protein [Spirosomataceae bacterium]